MKIESFKDKVEQELKQLNRKQQIHFAWRCAVRSLPFLGGSGCFDFWKKKDRQKYLFAIFYALDSAFAYYDYDYYNDDDINDYSAANTAYTAYSTANTASAAYSAAAYAANAANYAAIANAAFAAAAYDAAASTASAANAAAIEYNINIESVILRDLRAFPDNEKQPNPINLYGEIWDNFINALEAEGCAYWGNLYKNIFNNGLTLDKKALERRMNVPKEIQQQGAAEVAHYLEELEKGAERLNEARIIILGEKGAGKTCLARRLLDPNAPMTTENESTAGVDTTLWKLEEENINARIWDFAGHTVTHAVHQFFLSERCLYLIVYDGRTENRNKLDYWLNQMKNYGGDSEAMILINERDQHSVDIPINRLKEQYPIAGVYTFSIKKDKKDLEVFRTKVSTYIKSNPSWAKQKIPVNYYRVKEELEKLFDKDNSKKGKEHITKKAFEKIARKNDINDIAKLLNDLHALGVSLWYKDMEKYDKLILNPEWISHGIYKIINWLNEQKVYSLTLTDFVEVFEDDIERYPVKEHEFLFHLMEHYELAYQIQNKDCLIIPHLLKEDRPNKLPVFQVGESLMLRYKAEQPLPPDTISRFIVRHNQEIKKENNNYLVWRHGVVLNDSNGSEALVREHDRTIEVSVKGRDKTNYLSKLRKTLNDIFKKYQSDAPELQYRIERHGLIPEKVEARNPLWLSDRKIINYHNKEKLYYDDEFDQDIPLAKVVKIYNIKGDAIIDGTGHTITKNTLNFYKCNINLQGNLNDLSGLLNDNGHNEQARECGNVAKALEQVEKLKSPEAVKKTGVYNRLKRLVDDLGDEDSTLHKTVKGIKGGIGIAQAIAKAYNDIGQWMGLPQVPTPFLKK